VPPFPAGHVTIGRVFFYHEAHEGHEG